MAPTDRYVGDIWSFKIAVIDPDTGEPQPVEEAPDVTVVRPDRTEFAYAPQPEGDEYICLIRFTQPGPWRAIIHSQPPFDDIEVETAYANPTRD